MARQAAVACGNPATASAAASTLLRGGNAVDAIVAAGFAAAVAEPGLTSLGGGGFLLYRPPDGDDQVLDFFVDTPGRGLPSSALTPHFTPITVSFSGAEQVFHVGYGSVGVPGVLDGYLAAHRRFGELPLADVTAPARDAAQEGVPLARAQAEVLDLIHDIVTLTPPARAVFEPDRTRPQVGDLLRNRAYGDFLSTLHATETTGWRDVQTGRQIAADMAGHDGLVTLADLDAYEVIDRTPLVTAFRGARISTNPGPSFGGSIIVDALARLEKPSAGHTVIQAVSLVEALIYATERAKSNSRPQSNKGTTHISVADGAGGIASMTTSNGSCSGVMAGDSGVQLNNVMGESDLHPDGFHASPAGTRVGSMMSPTFVDLADGRMVAMGSGGSERIRSALLQAIVHLVNGATLTQAIEAPRIHHDGRRIQFEPGVRANVAAALGEIAPVNRWTSPNLYFGGVHAVMRYPDGRVEAVGDHRRDGTGQVVDL
ncbi:MAG TPA: gamma-glutamyltransferase [Actinomycetes bacterium]|nr:gamma-glutamyltransferase [Actinomycetes bacterium]